MVNEAVENQVAGNNDDADGACISDNEEEEEETEHDIPDQIYNFLNNYSKRKLIKVLLYYIRRQEGHNF